MAAPRVFMPEADDGGGEVHASGSSRSGRAATVSLVLLVAAIALVGGGWWLASRGLATAASLAKHGLWAEVHAPLGRYLWLHPSDPRANLLAAEAVVKDDSLPLIDRITRSLACLARVPDTADEAVAARIAEARVQLFLRYEPVAAERSLERAVKLDPQSLEAHLLRWKLLELTGRADDVEPVFWACYDLTPPEQKPLRLREWYVSQFFPQTSTAEIDTLMGFRLSPAEDGAGVEMRRLQRFRLAEPAEPLAHAALAAVFLRQSEAELALDILDEGASQMMPEQQADPRLTSQRIEALLELGEMEQAGEAFERCSWPPERRQSWLTRGRVLQEVGDDPAGAAEAYHRALVAWPGEVDWRTVNRLAGCLAQAGDAAAAADERQRVERIQAELLPDRLRELLDSLGDPADADVAARMAAFYRGIGRGREAEAWQAVATEGSSAVMTQAAPAAGP